MAEGRIFFRHVSNHAVEEYSRMRTRLKPQCSYDKLFPLLQTIRRKQDMPADIKNPGENEKPRAQPGKFSLPISW